jgi:hypothetical protein
MARMSPNLRCQQAGQQSRAKNDLRKKNHVQGK